MSEETSLLETHENVHEDLSFIAFYEMEFPRMVKIAYALSGSRLAAEDLAQEAMLATHRRWQMVRALDRPEAWTRRVLVNKATSQYRRRRAELRAIARLGLLRGSPPAPMAVEFTHVWDKVRSLPQRQAQAVVLFYVDDLPVVRIAEVMECSVNTVKVHLYNARRTLAQELELDEYQS
ncbi:MAG TPA: SigE family RNA polymerase sigma factor [Acidimicrobiia bacterium]